MTTVEQMAVCKTVTVPAAPKQAFALFTDAGAARKERT